MAQIAYPFAFYNRSIVDQWIKSTSAVHSRVITLLAPRHPAQPTALRHVLLGQQIHPVSHSFAQNPMQF
jgi:hypothetical protein